MKADRAIATYLQPFLDYCEVDKNLGDLTQRKYAHNLRVLTGWLERTGQADLAPTELTPAHISEFRLYLARTYKSPTGKTLSKASQSYYLIALRALLTYFGEKDIPSLPVSKVKLGRQIRAGNVSFLEHPELEALLAQPVVTTLDGLRDRALLETLFSTGMRLAELVGLNADRLTMLNEGGDSPKTIELGIIGKGKRARTVYLSPRACGWLREYLKARRDTDEALFVNNRKGANAERRLQPRAIQVMIGKYAHRAGLAKKVTPHTLRHSYATGLLSNGADLRSVQELLGHKNVATTQIYTHVTDKRLRDIHERFHGGPDRA